MIRLSGLLKLLFLMSYTFYVLSVSWYSWNNLNTVLYPLKHLSALFPCIFFFFLVLRDAEKKNHISLFLFGLGLIVIIIPFLGRSIISLTEFLLFVQSLVFFLAAFTFSTLFSNSNVTFSWRSLLYLALVFLSPLVLDIIFNSGNFLVTAYYGRERLLMGFYHPKEAGISFLILLVLWEVYRKRGLSFIVVFFTHLCAIVLLYFMQSRNCLIFYSSFLILNHVLGRVSLGAIVFVYFVLPLAGFAILISLYYNQLNELTSNRLDQWVSNLNISPFGRGSASPLDSDDLISKLHIDNYYLEYLVANGYVFFTFLIIFIFSVIFYLNRIRVHRIYVNSIFMPFLVFCFFDAGMFSSGNYLNIFVWSIVFAGIAIKIRSLSVKQSQLLLHRT